MTAAAARVPLTAPDAARPARRTAPLRLVPARRSSPRRAPFIAVVVGLLAAYLLVLLALNTASAQDAFTLHTLQVQGKELSDREQELATQVADLEAPAAIAQRAGTLGMLPGGPPAFLHLPDGTVSGQGSPASAPALVGDRVVPPAQDAAAATPDQADTPDSASGSTPDSPPTSSGSTR